MQNIAFMRERANFLRQQAEEFHRQSVIAESKSFRERLEELAKRCRDIAASIEQNISIHERRGE